jgi:predicted nucleotidyltransferase
MVVMKRYEILDILKKNKSDISIFGVNNIGLFGSFVRNENTNKSDIDFLIEFETDKKSFDNFMNLSIFLEDLFNKKIDLLTRESLDVDFYELVKNDVIYV